MRSAPALQSVVMRFRAGRTFVALAALAPHFLVVASPASATGPRLFAPAVVASGDSESHAVLSPDGATLYFLKLTPDFAHWTIVVAQRAESGWSAPVIAPFSGRYDDADVSFSPDGRTLWFVSNRPDRDGDPARADTDLFRMRRVGDGWSAPERIVALASAGS